MAVVGIDVGGTKCLGVALEDDEVVGELRSPTPEGSEPLLSALVEMVGRLGAHGRVEAVGLGTPGLVDRTGVLRFAPNLAVRDPVALRPALEERLGLKVTVDNDATCAAWGERELGAARGYDDVVLVTLGTGIGGGVVTGGRINRGANGFAGEIGHMVVDPEGPECPCGRRGCWERFASGSGLAMLAREAAAKGEGGGFLELAGGDPGGVVGEHVTRAVAEGDPAAVAVLDRFGWWVGLGLANLAAAFDPEAFVLGGGLVATGAPLLAAVTSAFAVHLPGVAARPPVDIALASLGERAGAIGAAGLASKA